MLLFPKGYFDDEEREGFVVSADMKSAWAAQLEVLKLIEEICDKYGLKYFAYYGTLLGAVRHNGFIPWDDDIDIAMLREDYEKLLEVAPNELPSGFFVKNARTREDAEHYVSRIVNSDCINANQGFLLKHYGCPYSAGVDIFPLDCVPFDESIKNEKDELIDLIFFISERVTGNAEADESNRLLQDGFDKLEKKLDFKFDRKGNMINQMINLFDFAASSYADPKAFLVSNYWNYAAHSKSFVFHRLWLSEVIELSFETDTVRAPIGLEAILSICFGNNFMTPVNKASHGTPFEDQRNQLIEGGLYDNVLETRKIIREVMCLGVPRTDEAVPESVPDDIINALRIDADGSFTDRKVILYALNSASIIRFGEGVIDKIRNTIKIFDENKDNAAMLLVEDVTFPATLNDMYPDAFDAYMSLKDHICTGGIGAVGDNLYYDYASLCDAYFGDGTSVIGSFMKVGKPVMLQNYSIV